MLQPSVVLVSVNAVVGNVKLAHSLMPGCMVPTFTLLQAMYSVVFLSKTMPFFLPRLPWITYSTVQWFVINNSCAHMFIFGRSLRKTCRGGDAKRVIRGVNFNFTRLFNFQGHFLLRCHLRFVSSPFSLLYDCSVPYLSSYYRSLCPHSYLFFAFSHDLTLKVHLYSFTSKEFLLDKCISWPKPEMTGIAPL